jgi:Zn-dependent metalloprotease
MSARHQSTTSKSPTLTPLLLCLLLLCGAPPLLADVESAVEDLRGIADSVLADTNTGTALFVRFGADGWPEGGKGEDPAAEADAFLGLHGEAFGLTDAKTQLRLVETREDGMTDGTHLVFEQVHEDLPVYAAELRLHFDAEGRLLAVNGQAFPNISTPGDLTVTSKEAEQKALALVAAEQGEGEDLTVAQNELLVYQLGLGTKKVGPAYRAHRVEVRGQSLREWVVIDAVTGEVVDRESGIREINRLLAESNISPTGGWSWTPLWWEGDAPLGIEEFDTIIDATKDIYDLVKAVDSQWITLPWGATELREGYRGYDGFDAPMTNLYGDFPLIPNPCTSPNAFWNGSWVSFCRNAGFGTDDVAAHEWMHAYTEHTAGLVYEDQPGALNESFSDIFGEAVDRLNDSGDSVPMAPRLGNECATYGRHSAGMEVNGHPAFPGNFAGGVALFGPPLDNTGISGMLELSRKKNDSNNHLACNKVQNTVSGKVALVDRGSCSFIEKVRKVEDAGAIAAVICNNVGGVVPDMLGGGPGVNEPGIPAVHLSQSVCDLLKAHLSDGLDVTLLVDIPVVHTAAHLVAEDSMVGAIRDMWNPNCFGDPGDTADAEYYCGALDNGGVHTNSGVPNHAFALLTDGGVHNGWSVQSIGVQRATAIYWQALEQYHTPTSDFSAHADAVEQACEDLVGRRIPQFSLEAWTGIPFGATFEVTADDCVQVERAMNAVYMRANPCP